MYRFPWCKYFPYGWFQATRSTVVWQSPWVFNHQSPREPAPVSLPHPQGPLGPEHTWPFHTLTQGHWEVESRGTSARFGLKIGGSKSGPVTDQLSDSCRSIPQAVWALCLTRDMWQQPNSCILLMVKVRHREQKGPRVAGHIAGSLGLEPGPAQPPKPRPPAASMPAP